ncbi:MAG: FKBP-type peptidyl-prolyl cis-trans isomerase [Paludibacteraceae bacterium]|nr:FKBP-type peptidyl-prolyl cis-trans isomerase [Paludibacteraceae bacterium]
MKLTKVAAFAFGCAALMTTACNGDIKSAAKGGKVATAQDTFNYALGYNYGKGLLDQMSQMPLGDKEAIMKKEAIIKGFAEALYGDSIMSEDAMRMSADNFFRTQMDKQKEATAKAFAEIAKKYEADGYKDLGKPNDPRMSDYDGPTVLMKVITEGKGDTIKITDFAYMEYEGKLAVNDTIFDTTKDKEPALLSPMRVIPGFAQALCQLKKGSKASFLIPSDLGYGPRESEKIPANSPLLFTVDIKEVFHNDTDARKFMEKLHPEMVKPQAPAAK